MNRSFYSLLLILASTLTILWLLPERSVSLLRAALVRKLAVTPSPSKYLQLEEAKSKAEAENLLLRTALLRLQDEEQLRRTMVPESVLAHLIYQDRYPAHQGCWVDVGSEDNTRLGRDVVVPNAPVVVGHFLIGLVDEVFPRQSRIRLLSDPAVRPAVRAARGHVQQVCLAQHLDEVMQEAPSDMPRMVVEYLEQWKAQLGASSPELLLAKGVLEGHYAGQERILRGTGFNCYLPDDLAPARELRSGRVVGEGQATAQPLIRKGDILITTGMDGVFPMGLLVARVVYIEPLIEGDCYYQLQAEWLAPPLDGLHVVSILPPVQNVEISQGAR